MFKKSLLCICVVAACLIGLCGNAVALEVDCDSIYCFSPEDLSSEETLMGVCITGLPDAKTGTIMLGRRVVRVGDILTAAQVAQMTFAPLQTQEDQDAVVTYLPIYENRVAPAVSTTISIRGKTDQPPVAEDLAIETYKNLPNDGALKVSDPEGQALTYSVIRQPKRGSVEVRADGTFTYTPKKNKVGVDSFTFAATDPAGNVSREATVTVSIIKPSDATQYTDTVGSSCRFEAEWLKNTGIFIGESIGGAQCFREDRSVSKGEFLTMVVKSLGIPVDENATATGYAEEIPRWLQPYLAAAMRSGLTSGIPLTDAGTLGLDDVITGAEAAVMLQNAMDLSLSTTSAPEDGDIPDWAKVAVMAMNDNGIRIHATDKLTRGQVAVMLYQANQLATEAPGLSMYQ
ncbi:MAG: hypothetical protein E7470_04160 [Ruminococcaceae bacterium]|nr:hypothetical protein [Oscillospiraceae bacterium]